jgi:hypothetical protein
MPNQLPLVLREGSSVAGPFSVGRVHLSEPQHAGQVVLKDGLNVLVTINYGGPGSPEPAAVVFNPPKLFTTGIAVTNSCGGFVHCLVQGTSGAGY